VGFAKAHHKIPPRRKGGRGPGLGSYQIFGVFPLIFMQLLKVSTSNLVHRAHHKITQMTKVGLGYGMVRSLQITHPPLIFFAMAEVAMDVRNKRYYIEKNAKINVKNKVYIQVLWTHASKTATIGTAEHFGVVTMCSTTKFTVPIINKLLS